MAEIFNANGEHEQAHTDNPQAKCPGEARRPNCHAANGDAAKANGVFLAAALAYAKRSIPVFPCRPHDKRPYVKNGFKAATTNRGQIKRWSKRWPHAMLGMPTGKASGIDVLDVDVKAGVDGFASVPDWQERTPAIVRTPSGGAHLYFKSAGKVRSTTAIRPGVDVRGTGGYVILPPSVTSPGGAYVFEKGNIGDPLPPWPKQFAQKAKRKSRNNEPPKTADNSPSASAELDAACAEIEATPKGERNEALNKAAFAMGQLIGAGFLDEATVVERLTEAAKEVGLDENEIPKTIASGTTAGKAVNNSGVRLDDFRAYLPDHDYVYMPTGAHWPASSVNAVLKLGKQKASEWLDQNRAVQQKTWAPGEDPEIANRLITDGGWTDNPGCATLNLYRPPTIKHIPGDISLWLNHAKRLCGEHTDHVLDYIAHRVQRPQEKINHALVLGGAQGIGKDTLLEPVKHAVGPWNFGEASPQQVLGRFNGFLKSVVLRISEARDLGDVNRYAFYDHLKSYLAAPPDTLRVDEKFKSEYYVANVLATIITTNHKSDGIFLPADDRRHFVIWSKLTKDDFTPGYWKDLWGFFDNGGNEAVAHYLANRDLSNFDPKKPPPKTEAFWEIVHAGQAPEDGELADVLDKLGRPEAVTIAMVAKAVEEIGGTGNFWDWLKSRQNARRIPHRMEACGYTPVRNPDAKDGLWRVADDPKPAAEGARNRPLGTATSRGLSTRKVATADDGDASPRRCVVYARAELSPEQRRTAAEKLRG